jgi:predicted alpha/beta superfamily hydrolase
MGTFPPNNWTVPVGYGNGYASVKKFDRTRRRHSYTHTEEWPGLVR